MHGDNKVIHCQYSTLISGNRCLLPQNNSNVHYIEPREVYEFGSVVEVQCDVCCHEMTGNSKSICQASSELTYDITETDCHST